MSFTKNSESKVAASSQAKAHAYDTSGQLSDGLF